ncbi:hypothetical protein ACLB2K_077275 [Fragaria x ananassa]
MVLLLGACPEYGCLIYEYMANGSLEDRLFRRGNTPVMAAKVPNSRRNCHGAFAPSPSQARTLGTPKISDVGLSRLVPPSVADSVTQYHMTSAAGTFCYIDPEYQQTGLLGTKSDIYSLGVMLLQIITAKQAMGLTHLVEHAIEIGTFAEMLDPAVPDWPVEEALKFAKLALQCAQMRRKDRPDLGTIERTWRKGWRSILNTDVLSFHKARSDESSPTRRRQFMSNSSTSSIIWRKKDT